MIARMNGTFMQLIIVVTSAMLFNCALAGPEATGDSDRKIGAQRDTSQISESIEEGVAQAKAKRVLTQSLARSSNGSKREGLCGSKAICDEVSSSIVVLPGAVVIGPLINAPPQSKK